MEFSAVALYSSKPQPLHYASARALDVRRSLAHATLYKNLHFLKIEDFKLKLYILISRLLCFSQLVASDILNNKIDLGVFSSNQVFWKNMSQKKYIYIYIDNDWVIEVRHIFSTELGAPLYQHRKRHLQPRRLSWVEQRLLV